MNSRLTLKLLPPISIAMLALVLAGGLSYGLAVVRYADGRGVEM